MSLIGCFPFSGRHATEGAQSSEETAVVSSEKLIVVVPRPAALSRRLSDSEGEGSSCRRCCLQYNYAMGSHVTFFLSLSSAPVSRLWPAWRGCFGCAFSFCPSAGCGVEIQTSSGGYKAVKFPNKTELGNVLSCVLQLMLRCRK